jgi:creatinine amidohydrolase
MNALGVIWWPAALAVCCCLASAQDVSGVQLENLIHPEAKARAIRVAVLPIGSTEPHANHLPYGCDAFTAGALAARAAWKANQMGAQAMVLPAMPYGVNTNVVGIPYTQSLRPGTMIEFVRDVVDGLERQGVRKVVIVSSHGGNTTTLGTALRELFASHRKVFVALVAVSDTYRDKLSEIGVVTGAHASEAETSLALALFPEKVRMERVAKPKEAELKLKSLQAGFITFVRPWNYVSDTTGSGDPTRATAEKGRKLVDLFVERMAAFLKELSDAELTEAFPY